MGANNYLNSNHTKYLPHVLNLSVSCGAIWRRRGKPQYRCTTTIHRVHKSPKLVLENLLSIWLLVRTNLFIPSRFWTTYMRFDNCCLRYIARCGKILYVHISAMNNCGGIFFKSLSYLYEVVHTNFSADFWTFRIFWWQFRENCGAI